MIRIEELKKVLPDDREKLSTLSRELHQDGHALTREDLESMIRNQNTALMVVKDDERIVGMATLFILYKLSERISVVEDVIVDSAYRGQGLGKRLMESILTEAKKRGAKSISLTSQPKRLAANKLYESVGFEKRETNVYKISLS